MDDLARVRLANGPELMWEVLLSLHRLRDQDGTSVFGDWRRRIRAHLPAEALSPDFLSTAGGGDLGRRYYEIGLAPFWPQISTAVRTDLTARTATLVNEGIGTLLSDLHPRVRWRPPVLEVPCHEDRHSHLAGRGLLLVPSFFCWGRPMMFQNPESPSVFVYPIEHDLGWAQGSQHDRSPRSVAALIGRTRLSVLTSIADGGCTTTQLARRAGVSIASASQHAAVLRNAGLITTTRRGSCVIHVATPAAQPFVTRQPDTELPTEYAR